MRYFFFYQIASSLIPVITVIDLLVENLRAEEFPWDSLIKNFCEFRLKDLLIKFCTSVICRVIESNHRNRIQMNLKLFKANTIRQWMIKINKNLFYRESDMRVNAIFHYSESFKALKQNFLYTELRHLLTKLKLLAILATIYTKTTILIEKDE
jgi:hypothetical protein